MEWSPFAGKSLSQLDESDLDALVTEEVREGLFVEYKSAWEPFKIARAVASFANTHGGYLVVGIDTDGTKPTGVVGVSHHGDLEESAVNVLRSRIAPIPNFTPRTVDRTKGDPCLVVEVPEGSQPPYLIISDGSILVRTPTSSEPVRITDREALDRMFLKGERGSRWAANEAAELLKQAGGDAVWTATIPTVEGGLTVPHLVFRLSFAERMLASMKASSIIGVSNDRDSGWRHSQQAIELSALSAFGNDRSLNVVIDTRGMIRCRLGFDPTGRAWEELDVLMEWSLPWQSALYGDELAHRGAVDVAIFAHRSGAPGLRIQRSRVSLDELKSIEFRNSVLRELHRSRGYRDYEPEP